MLVGEEGGVTMEDVAELQADRREAGSKGAVREMRRVGRVPGGVVELGSIVSGGAPGKYPPLRRGTPLQAWVHKA